MEYRATIRKVVKIGGDGAADTPLQLGVHALRADCVLTAVHEGRDTGACICIHISDTY